MKNGQRYNLESEESFQRNEFDSKHSFTARNWHFRGYKMIFYTMKINLLNQSGCLAVFTKDWFQSFLIKGSKIFHWSANYFSVFCFPWAKVWKNINILVIYHTNLFYVKFLQKCHQLSNFWFELFFYNSGHLQQLHFFLLLAGINPIFWKNAKFVNLWK